MTLHTKPDTAAAIRELTCTRDRRRIVVLEHFAVLKKATADSQDALAKSRALLGKVRFSVATLAGEP